MSLWRIVPSLEEVIMARIKGIEPTEAGIVT
jgi:hypothetical protein